MRVTSQGIQEEQARNNRLIAAMRPDGALGEGIRRATMRGHRYAVAITHVDRGALRAAHRMVVSRLQGVIFIDESAVNPKSGQRPHRYGVFEHDRGGAHAFYDRTVDERGDAMIQDVADSIGGEIE
jgi:hypothetical protein